MAGNGFRKKRMFGPYVQHSSLKKTVLWLHATNYT